jgi:hypothetical protein
VISLGEAYHRRLSLAVLLLCLRPTPHLGSSRERGLGERLLLSQRSPPLAEVPEGVDVHALR